MNLWAVIPSRDRPDMLRNLVNQLINDEVNVVIIDTGYEKDAPYEDPDQFVHVIRDDAQPLNISRWWNLGLDHVKHAEGDAEHVVAVLNDDLVIPPGFVMRLAQAIVAHNAAAAYPDQYGFNCDYVHRVPVPISLYRRMTGYAFALRGSANIRADETLQWWYGDDDIDWTARQRGGSVLVGGLRVQHLLPNSTTVGNLATQAGLDRGRFKEKWGRTPW
jgi:glycosyltransferase involved in cell wall biosynthesis